MIFNHDFIEFEELEAESVNGVRMYNTPDGKRYPSVTSILGAGENKGLDAWKKRVGEKEAKRIASQSASRGSEMHQMCEDYIANIPIDYAKLMPSTTMMFESIRPFIDKHVNDIRAIEIPLFSHRMKAAGRVDLIASWDGVPAIIDWKTSKGEKKPEWLAGYKQQAAAYAVMYYEMTGILIEKLVVVIAVANGKSMFVEAKRSEWIDEFMKARKLFEELKGY